METCHTIQLCVRQEAKKKQWCNEDNSLHARSMSYLAESKGLHTIGYVQNLAAKDPRYGCASVSTKCTFAFVISPKEMDYLHGVRLRHIHGVYVLPETKYFIRNFKLSPCSECYMLSSR